MRDGPPDPAQAAKLTVYLGRHERVDGSPAFVAVCKALHDSGVAGATVLLGVDGTRHGERERARFFARNAERAADGDQRRRSEPDQCGDRPSRADAQQAIVHARGRARMQARRHAARTTPRRVIRAGEYGMDICQKLTIVISRRRHVRERRSVYLELVRRLRAASAAGATSMRGIWGFHGDHAPHGDRLLLDPSPCTSCDRGDRYPRAYRRPVSHRRRADQRARARHQRARARQLSACTAPLVYSYAPARL